MTNGFIALRVAARGLASSCRALVVLWRAESTDDVAPSVRGLAANSGARAERVRLLASMAEANAKRPSVQRLLGRLPQIVAQIESVMADQVEAGTNREAASVALTARAQELDAWLSVFETEL